MRPAFSEDPNSCRQCPERPEIQPEASRLKPLTLGGDTQPKALTDPQTLGTGTCRGLQLTPGSHWDPQALGTWGWREGSRQGGLLQGLASLDKDTGNDRPPVPRSLTSLWPQPSCCRGTDAGKRRLSRKCGHTSFHCGQPVPLGQPEARDLNGCW